MSEQLPVGTRVRWALADGPADANGNGMVVNLEEWDEDPPIAGAPASHTRVQWDSGVREWVYTVDLIELPADGSS